MTLGELLDDIRASSLTRFREAIGEHESKAGARVILESVSVDASGARAREGMLDLPLRCDLAVLRETQTTEILQVEAKRAPCFEPIRFTWDEALNVLLSPFQWNCCPIALSPAPSPDQLSPLIEWFEHWFEAGGDPDPPFAGVVHSLSDPESHGDWSCLTLDLGSAPVLAFEGLLGASIRVGASRLCVGEEAPGTQ